MPATPGAPPLRPVCASQIPASSPRNRQRPQSASPLRIGKSLLKNQIAPTVPTMRPLTPPPLTPQPLYSFTTDPTASTNRSHNAAPSGCSYWTTTQHLFHPSQLSAFLAGSKPAPGAPPTHPPGPRSQAPAWERPSPRLPPRRPQKNLPNSRAKSPEFPPVFSPKRNGDIWTDLISLTSGLRLLTSSLDLTSAPKNLT